MIIQGLNETLYSSPTLSTQSQAGSGRLAGACACAADARFVLVLRPHEKGSAFTVDSERSQSSLMTASMRARRRPSRLFALFRRIAADKFLQLEANSQQWWVTRSRGQREQWKADVASAQPNDLYESLL